MCAEKKKSRHIDISPAAWSQRLHISLFNMAAKNRGGQKNNILIYCDMYCSNMIHCSLDIEIYDRFKVKSTCK